MANHCKIVKIKLEKTPLGEWLTNTERSGVVGASEETFEMFEVLGDMDVIAKPIKHL